MIMTVSALPARTGTRLNGGYGSALAGKEARFEGPFPVEIAPLARELNALLQSNREIIERARVQVGNLAHALKTPLSVITNESRATEGQLANGLVWQILCRLSWRGVITDRLSGGLGRAGKAEAHRVEAERHQRQRIKFAILRNKVSR